MVMVAKVAPVAVVKGRVGRRGAFELLVNGQMVRMICNITNHHHEVKKGQMWMQVYSRLVTGKFPDFPATAAMVAKVFHFSHLLAF